MEFGQVSRHTRLTEKLTGMGFHPFAADPLPGANQLNNVLIFMLAYVDVLLIVARSRAHVNWAKAQLTSSSIEAHDLGEAHYFLGIVIVRDQAASTVKLGQRRVTTQLVEIRSGRLQDHGGPLRVSAAEHI